MELDLAQAVLLAADARHAGVQVQGVLHEVQVPPLLVFGVVHRAILSAAGRAGKPRATLEVEEQVEALGLAIELRAGDLPGRDEAEGLLEELPYPLHGLTSAAAAFRSPATLRRSAYPPRTARSH